MMTNPDSCGQVWLYELTEESSGSQETTTEGRSMNNRTENQELEFQDEINSVNHTACTASPSLSERTVNTLQMSHSDESKNLVGGETAEGLVSAEDHDEMIEIHTEAGQILVPASMSHIIHNSDVMAILHQAASLQQGSSTSLTIEMEEGKATKIHSTDEAVMQEIHDEVPTASASSSDDPEVFQILTSGIESPILDSNCKIVMEKTTYQQEHQEDCQVTAITQNEQPQAQPANDNRNSETYIPQIKVFPSVKKGTFASGRVVEVPLTGPSSKDLASGMHEGSTGDMKESCQKSCTTDAGKYNSGVSNVTSDVLQDTGRQSPKVIEIKPTESKMPISDIDDDVVTVSVTRGRPKRKASFGVAALTKELGKKRMRYDSSPGNESVIPSQPVVKRGRGRPRKYPLTPSGINTSKEGKENRPLSQQTADKQPVMVNIIVKDKTILPFVNNMGIYMMFYCRNCTYFGRSMLTVADHIAKCKGTPIAHGSVEENIANETLEAAALKEVFMKPLVDNKNKDEGKSEESCNSAETSGRKEHSYATAEIHFEDIEERFNEEDSAGDSVRSDALGDIKEKKPIIENIPDSRKWFCPECHYTFFHSEAEFEIHKKCHGKSGRGDIHCYICFRKKKEDWHRLKGHLHLVHKLDFQLRCDECGNIYAAHVDYNKHCSGHKRKCKYEFCRFESQSSSDMDTHERCHLQNTPKHFKCYKCGYQCKLRPHKWSTMHSHLVTRHHGIIEPLYKCENCDKGFQEMRRYSAHVKICRRGNPISFKEECKVCGKGISSIHMERHLKTHLAEAQNAEEIEISKEANQDPLSVDATKEVVSGTEEIARSNENPHKNTDGDVAVPDSNDVTSTRCRINISRTLSRKRHNPFFCHKHCLSFDTQEMLTQHLVTVHWEVTPEKIAEAQERKKEIQKLMAEVKKKRKERTLKSQHGKTAASTIEKSCGVPTSDTLEHDGVEGSQADQGKEDQVHQVVFPKASGGEISSLQVKNEAALPELIYEECGDKSDKTEDCDDMKNSQKMLCVECNQEFIGRDNFRNHYRMTHSARQHQDLNTEQIRCRHCYKKFFSEERLEKHVRRVHTAEKMKPVLCQICGRGYRNRVQFRNHYRVVHEGIKRKKPTVPYKRPPRKYLICETCGYTTPEAVRLRNHQLAVHEGVMPYQCELCNYKTSEKSDMRRHKQKHMGIKRHICQFCPYRTNQRWLLVAHCLKQHNYQMPKVKRDTRGCYWSNSNSRKQDKVEIVKYETTETMEISADQFSQEHVIAILPESLANASTFTHVVTEHSDGNSLHEQQVAVEMIEADTSSGEVVYVHEDGTLLEPEEQAALMLLAVAPVTAESEQTD